MDNEDKLKTMTVVIEDLNKENEDLKSRYAELSFEFDLYKSDNKTSMEKAKEIIAECTALAKQYRDVIKELNDAKSQYEQALRDVKEIKEKYRKKVNQIINDIN